MNFIAKIISLGLAITMLMSVCVAFAFSASSTDSPVLNVEVVSKTEKEIVADINLESGEINCLDIVFSMSGVSCKKIEAGRALDENPSAYLASNPGAPINSNFISIASTTCIKAGTLATVTLEIIKEDFNFSISVSNCSVLIDEEEEALSPIVNGGIDSDDFTTTEPPHVHNEVIITTPAGCTSSGTIICYCEGCGETLYTREIPATGHIPGEWVIVSEPTPLTEGTKALYCANCEEIISTENIDIIPSVVHEVSVNDAEMNYKDTIIIEPAIVADPHAEYTVTFSSSDTKIATVNENGEVYATGRGTATITCTITDSYGNETSDVCEIKVTYTWWQWIVKILLLGFLWY